MTSSRCEYTWPQDHEVDDPPNHQSCCYRRTLPRSDRCPWHADSTNVEKSPKSLKGSLTDSSARENTSLYSELLDGANVSNLDLSDICSFERVTLREADLSNTNLKNTNLSDANLTQIDLSGADLTNATLSGSKIWNSDLSNAQLSNTDCSGTELKLSNLSNLNGGSQNFSGADLGGATISNAFLWGSNFNNANLGGANLSSAVLRNANLQDAYLSRPDSRLGVTDDTTFHDADVSQANLSNANLSGSDLSDADFSKADLTGTDLRNANLSDANLQGADLINANIEHAKLIRTNLFGVDLSEATPHGATFTDVQINDGTEVRSEEKLSAERQWWQRGLFRPTQRCGYDPNRSRTHQFETIPVLRTLYGGYRMFSSDTDNADQLSKAADTYQTFEKLARENARPSLQSEMFVLRQDMQRKRYWHNSDHFSWLFAQVSRAIFKYGESLARIFSWAAFIIAVFGIVYWQFDLIINVNGQFVTDPIDAIYFSTLTFTTLGLGDFQPSPASELARLLVTSQAALGAILIAIFVFVLGRRAAR